jgi:hypothetical protein
MNCPFIPFQRVATWQPSFLCHSTGSWRGYSFPQAQHCQTSTIPVDSEYPIRPDCLGYLGCLDYLVNLVNQILV